MRYDIISDTHGYLPDALLRELEGADFIVHAGDICSTSDLKTLRGIAEVKFCLGNNDFGFDYGPLAQKLQRFYSEGHRFQICHYKERLELDTADIAICGHTHKPFIENDPKWNTLIMNPGSPVFPRAVGASMGRIIIEDNKIISSEIILLDI